MEFVELSDDEWSLISSYFPPKSSKGKKALVDDRVILNGILYVLFTGCLWMDMLIRYGSYVTAWKRLKQLQEHSI